MPRASILIPTYSRTEELRDCIIAALGSSIEDIEVVVGDNGAAGRAVCESIADPRLRYIAHPHNLGMSGNWSALLECARSEHVVLCSDDDRIHATFVERCLGVFEDDPMIDVVFTNHSFSNGADETPRPTLLRAGRYDDFALLFLCAAPVAASATMFKRSLWPLVRPLPDSAAADMVLFGRLAECGCVFFYVDEILMSYAIHDAMLSSSEAFRTDVVTAWSSLRFTSRRAEHERRRLLVRSLASRARLSIRHGRREEAREDLRRAVRVGGARRVGDVLSTALVTLAPSWAVRALIRVRRGAPPRPADGS